MAKICYKLKVQWRGVPKELINKSGCSPWDWDCGRGAGELRGACLKSSAASLDILVSSTSCRGLWSLWCGDWSRWCGDSIVSLTCSMCLDESAVLEWGRGSSIELDGGRACSILGDGELGGKRGDTPTGLLSGRACKGWSLVKPRTCAAYSPCSAISAPVKGPPSQRFNQYIRWLCGLASLS